MSASSAESEAPQPLVSVIIATRNRPRELRAVLDCLKTQAYREYEVIVVDQSDQHVPLGADYQWVTEVVGEPTGAAAARNLGLKHAHGAVIIYIDDDVIIEGPTFVAEHVGGYQDPAVGAVCGRCIEVVMRHKWGGAPGIVPVLCLVTGAPESQVDCDVKNLKGANMSFRRDVLVAVGGFDERFGAPCMYEESDVAGKVQGLGFKIAYRSDAVLIHLGAPGGGQRAGDQNNNCRYLAYRDRVLLFVNNMPRYTFPLFLLGNVFLALRPLLHFDFRSTYLGLSGLTMGVRKYMWETR